MNPTQPPESVLVGKIAKISRATFDGLPPERQASVMAIDQQLIAIEELLGRETAGLSRPELSRVGQDLAESCERLFSSLDDEESWLNFTNRGQYVEHQQLGRRVWMNHLPLYAAAEGCRLIAIVDTETTGVGLDDEPITVAAILLEVEPKKGHVVRIIDRYAGRREPAVRISPAAHAVHGLTAEDLRGARLDHEHLERILRSANLVVAHNAKFDRRMLRHVLVDADGLPWACSMLALRRLWDERVGRRSLDAICEHLAIERPPIHDANADCEALLGALTKPSGKTARSKTYMALLIAAPWCPRDD